jgi:hypothetical protein
LAEQQLSILPQISIKERSIQDITDVLIHKGFRGKLQYFNVGGGKENVETGGFNHRLQKTLKPTVRVYRKQTGDPFFPLLQH